MSLYDLIKNASNKANAFELGLTMAAREHRQLVSVMLELSPICNFSCPFCYVRKTPFELEAEGGKVLRFSYWKNIIDQLWEMGVIYITLTGGECMLHPDFIKIYTYIAQKGMFVSLISNGSCLTDDILETLIKYPPKRINVTVYGMSEIAYQKVCGNGLYFEKVRQNIERMANAGLPLRLQTTVSKDNYKDLISVYQLSKQYNLHFGYTYQLFQFGECTEEKFENNYINEEIHNEILRLMEETSADQMMEEKEIEPIVPKMQEIDKGVACSAGRNVAAIRATGFMTPCISYDRIQVSTHANSLEECWKIITDGCDKIPRIAECNGCIHWDKCQHCFAMHYYDTKDYKVPSPRLCFKKLYPDEARKIEEYYEKNGKLPPKTIQIKRK